jgi:hypothetical protein
LVVSPAVFGSLTASLRVKENTLYDIISIAGRLDIDSVNKEIRCGQGGAADDFTVTFSECLFEVRNISKVPTNWTTDHLRCTTSYRTMLPWPRQEDERLRR